MNPVKLLWTSGWDSTFRLLQLIVNRNVLIEPYYVVDIERPSAIIELQTMQKLRNLIYTRFPWSKERVLPAKIYVIYDIKQNAEITTKYNNLLKKSHLGSQYDWLARFANQLAIDGLEISIHDDAHPNSFVNTFIKPNVEKAEDPVTGLYYRFREDISDDDDRSLFKYFRFPILGYSKAAMFKEAETNNISDILMNTWFCHTPKGGKPCGLCAPCKYLVEDGMTFRLPPEAIMRHRFIGKPKDFAKRILGRL